MSKAHLTHANEVFYGDALNHKAMAYYGRKGIPLNSAYYYNFGAVAALDADGHCAAQAVAAAGYATINGALAGVNDVPRGIRAASASASDTTQTITIRGTDLYGNALTETLTLTGTTAVNGKKAFKTVSSVYVSAATAGNITVGTNDVLGLPFAATKKARIIDVFFNDAKDASATIVVADTTSPATATTGDVRGTVDPNSACNGSDVVVIMIPDATNAFGVDQYAG